MLSVDLLPEGKVAHLEQLKANFENRVAFVGDGINDTPVLALSDVGIAMGGLGCDAAIETADVVIQTDQPSKVAEAIKNRKTDPSHCMAKYIDGIRSEIVSIAIRSRRNGHYVGSYICRCRRSFTRHF